MLDPRWVVVVASAAVAFGALSAVVSARKLYYFASSLPHAALLAAVLGYPLAAWLGGDPLVWALAVGVPLSYGVVYLVERGVEEDVATAVFVSFSVAASVAAIYYVLTHFSLSTSLWSLVIGDPLLASWRDAWWAVGLGCFVAAAVLLSYREQVVIGVDRDFAATAGLRVRLYDYLVVTALAVASIGLLRAVGFVVEHVMILLPSAAAVNVSDNSVEALGVSLLASVFAGLAGLLAGVALDVAPSAAIGFILLGVYMASLWAREG